MNERLRFVARYLEGDLTVVQLREELEISRTTAYKWIARWEELGPDGLKELSRAPHRAANAIPAHVKARVIQARRDHPTWGPRKLLAWLGKQDPTVSWPAPSTVGNWLRDTGLAKRRRRRGFRRKYNGKWPVGTQDEPNETWATGFKGDFPLQDGRRCYP